MIFLADIELPSFYMRDDILELLFFTMLRCKSTSM